MSSSATPLFPSLQGDQVPAGSRPILEKVKKGFGLSHTLRRVLEFPGPLEGYLGLDAVYSRGTLSAAERQLAELRGFEAFATLSD